MVTMGQIQKAVASYFSISVEQLTSPDRSAIDTARRAVAFRLCNELLATSYKAIGHAFGGRDHTTVIRAIERPLALDNQVAFEMIKADLTTAVDHSELVIRRWPFKSRRQPCDAVFSRRHTA